MEDAGRRQLGRILSLVIVVAAAATSLRVYVLSTRHPRTDDAFVRANVIGIAPHVSGPIVELPLVDNQPVRQGELLFVVDPRPYEARLEAARAELDLVQADLEAQRAALSAAEAELARREADADYASDYLGRVEPLLKRDFVTADRVADARAKHRAATAAVSQARAERERAVKLLADVGGLNARREAAEAALKSAELDVAYCRVAAPFDGWVTNLNISVGEYARQGQPVFALVDGRTWWVVANFRETDLHAIRPGMAAAVTLMSYPGRRFAAVVDGIGWAVRDTDGDSETVLPLVEPTLNWVRLARRFPVRIRLTESDPERPFRMGATAVVTIRGD
ncbi:MAG: HlyD family efflux transporter periplasmic adaptor subunit [bacterium]|nr:HlyD family efflux transporter periplasmic adaptor subunit [bacterium]